MAGDAGNSESAVEVVTQSYAITGRCSGLTEQIRLIDLLNNPEITHLQLGGVRVRELIGSQDIVTSEGPFFIDKEFIVFGRSMESAEAEEKRRQTHRVDYVEIKRNLLREPIFMTTVHKRMARMYLGKATIEEVFSEIEQSKTKVKLQ